MATKPAGVSDDVWAAMDISEATSPDIREMVQAARDAKTAFFKRNANILGGEIAKHAETNPQSLDPDEVVEGSTAIAAKKNRAKGEAEADARKAKLAAKKSPKPSTDPRE